MRRCLEQQLLRAVCNDDGHTSRLQRRVWELITAVVALREGSHNLADEFAATLADPLLSSTALRLRDGIDLTLQALLTGLETVLNSTRSRSLLESNQSAAQDAFFKLLSVQLRYQRTAAMVVEDLHITASKASHQEDPSPRQSPFTPPLVVPLFFGPSVDQATPAPQVATLAPEMAQVPLAPQGASTEHAPDDQPSDGELVNNVVIPATVEGAFVDLLRYNSGMLEPDEGSEPPEVLTPAPEVTTFAPEMVQVPPAPQGTSTEHATDDQPSDGEPITNVGISSGVEGAFVDLLGYTCETLEPNEASAPPGTGANSGARVPTATFLGGFPDGFDFAGAAPVETEAAVRARVEMWHKRKNLRAMLFSLHEVAPVGSWRSVSLEDLQTQEDVKATYRRALLSIHPDKQPQGMEDRKLLGQLVFQALRQKWSHENHGTR